jgi:peptidoglycan/LPS O-acetylase OafA/YrhL
MTKPTAAGTSRFEVLDSLRGVCACMIVLLHFKTAGMISQARIVENGHLFVDFFFVLSGFVIAASYGDRLAQGFSIGKFLGLRFGRIYPLHIVILLGFVLFELIFATGALGGADRQPFQQPNDVRSLIASIFLVQTFVGPDATFWNGPSWSIAVEMWTYLVFAVMFRWLRWMIVPVALILAAACAFYLYGLTDRYLNVFHDGAFARCLYGFGLGVVAFNAHRALRGRSFSAGPGTVLEVLVVAVTIAMIIAAGSSPLSLLMPWVFFAAILIFAQQRGLVSRLLLMRPFVFVGMLSYSIYMVHAFLQYRLVNVLALIGKLSHGRLALTADAAGHNQVGGGPLLGDVMSIVVLGLTILCAYASYHLVEKPGQRWSRRVILGPHPSPKAVVVEREAPTF